jgi:mono/diheme cytochrome c family protein
MDMTFKSVAAASLLLMISMSTAVAGAPEGKAIAERWCVECHIVSLDQEKGTEGVPSFAELARVREDDALKAFLFDPHPTMAGLALSTREIADVIAYIRTFGPAPE